MADKKKYKYDIAISFAEEEHDIAKMLDFVFRSRRFRKIKAFYYPRFKSRLMGEDLHEILPKIYESEARYALIILSGKYLTKEYCQIELEAIRKRRHIQEDRYAFVVKKDLTKLTDIGFPEGFVYYQWNHDPEQLTEILSQILKPRKAFWPIAVMVILIVACIGGVNMYHSKDGNSEPLVGDEAESVENIDESADKQNGIYRNNTITNTDSNETSSLDDAMLDKSLQEKMNPGSQNIKSPEGLKKVVNEGAGTSSNADVGDNMYDAGETYPYWDIDSKNRDTGQQFEKELIEQALFTQDIEATSKADIAILIVDSVHNQQTELARAMDKKLREEGYNAYWGLLNTEIVNPFVFRKLASNNIWFLKKYSPEQKLDHIILGELTWFSSINDLGSPSLIATLKLTVLNLKGISSCDPVSFTAEGSDRDKKEILKGLANKIALELSCNFSED
ncbi:MAG TPA: hypothetical protein DCG19_14015 [Cryomorphaceae bacterium]|nr:hypothetical protein [Owenweeksia sp.]HAD98521.1 hypothetical protein [Cryomorphaceae bacterium]HBF21832.1 hypothetical protein [Cryomorphaceae bacterium]|tara:strand:+ start:12825 stop:14168 length:1344 start_codon:yes stop_codon:yes gene_type:complete